MKTSQKGFIVPLIIVIVAALGIGGGVYYSKKAKEKTKVEMETQGTVDVRANENTNTSASLSGNASMNLTLKELLAYGKGKNIMCTGSTTMPNGGTVKSTSYIENGANVRADTTMTYNGTTTTGGVIMKGNTVFAWSGSKGTKMTLDGTLDLDAALGKGSTYQADGKSSYTCNSWIADESKFTAPASVTFTDYGSIKLPSATGTVDMKTLINTNAKGQ